MIKKTEKAKIILQAPKGMHDILADEYAFYQSVFERAEKIASYYGFQPIQTPTLERTELFTVGTGATTDIVQKQMYSLRTRGGDHLALRPEGTPGVMRAYLEHGMHTLPQPVMFWYGGSFFRHENPQKGRFREFQQFGMEIVGESKPIAEVIIIRVLKSIFEELDFPLIVHINSIGDKECRPVYRKELVNYYRRKINSLCPDCKRRLRENPFRLLDCKEEKCRELRAMAPQTVNYLCSSCKQHFREVLEALDSADIFYILDNHLVRGLDYYSRTVFEIFENTPTSTEEETITGDALAGGGRYDYLAKTLSKKDFPAVGVAIGVDRLVQLMRDRKMSPRQKKQAKIFLVQLGSAAKYKSLEIIEMFRKNHILLGQSISKDSLRGQLNLASKLNMDYALILGQQEVLKNSIILRDMRSGNQEIIENRDLVEVIKKKLAHD